jgi:hypothetical protein
MVWPGGESPLGGILGATTCSVYRLDPTGSFPVEPLPDVLPGVFTPFRVTLDLVEQEMLQSDCDVTQHPVQDFLDVVSHVHKRPDSLTVTGVLTAALKTPIQGLPSAGVRFDLIRVRNLRRLQAQRAPLMVVTPHASLAKCFLASVSPTWGRADGEQTTISLTFVEARLVSPLLGAEVVPDFPAQESGNSKVIDAGQVAPAVEAATVAEPPLA